MAVMAQADDVALTQEIHRVISAAVDPDFYRTIYTDLPAEIGPLFHYRVQGWREGRDPAPWFSVPDYLADNPDVAEAGTEPLFHFLSRGRYEGRDVRPSRHSVRYLAGAEWTPEAWGYRAFAVGPSPTGRRSTSPSVLPALSRPEERALIATEFDAEFYLAINPDVAASSMEPVAHFVTSGWLEGRDPNARFSVRDYLELYPDVAAAGMNPFAHYLAAGRAEGRIARQDLGFRYDVIARMKPVSTRIAEAVAVSERFEAQPAAVLAERLATLRDLHITFSHDDYLAHSGGLQICLRRESARFAAMGVGHLHLFPAAPWPAVREAGEPGPLGVMLNGVDLGVFAPSAVREAVAKAAAPDGRRSFAIHSLLGHAADDTAEILAAAGLTEGFFWLHDFASLCSGVHLLRDDVEDCAAPPADSAACGICAYGPARARHLDAHRHLFQRLSLTVVAPSLTTLDFWRSRTDLPAAGARVLPHADLVARGPAPGATRPHAFRIAFLGMPIPLKGWPIFRDLAQRFADDPRYAFLHLGGRPDPAAPAAFHPVVVTDDRPDAMREAVEALEVDAALIWPLCRETFSFTAYEAAAGGAAVVTGPDSGNVAAFAADPDRGRILADETALATAFETGEILALARAQRKAGLYDLAYSGLTGDLAAERRA